jgi:predicted nuclease of predicted toxin-antitoxin system
MKFVVDECTGPVVAAWLAQQGHDVVSIYDESPGVDDDAILHRSFTESRILITGDKDFGELIFRDNRPHHGVVLLRLTNDSPANRIRVLGDVLQAHGNSVADQFVVVSDSGVRFASP